MLRRAHNCLPSNTAALLGRRFPAHRAPVPPRAHGGGPGVLQHAQYDSIEARTSKYVESLTSVTGVTLGCPPGCGACCLSPTVESTPWECVPMAQELIRLGRGEEMLERLEQMVTEQDPVRQCIFYEPHGDPSLGKGRCSMYGPRPLVCRLFGFAASRAKDGSLDLAVCKVMKTTMPEQVAVAKAATKQGKVPVPVYSDEWAELHSTVVGTREATVMPINQAFLEALHSQLWRQHLASLGAGEDQEEEQDCDTKSATANTGDVAP